MTRSERKGPERRAGHGALARAAAATAVDQVLTAGRSLDVALNNELNAKLGPRDQAQVMALAYGALRWHHRHKLILDQLLDRPLRSRDRILEALLSVGLFQLIDARQPGYASVSTTVDATRKLRQPRASKLVNATLRRFQREQDLLLRDALAVEQGRYSNPPWLIDMLRRDWGEQAGQIMTHSLTQAPMWLRLNTARADWLQFCTALEAVDATAVQPLSAIPTAVRLNRPLAVDDIPGFSAGHVSVQDAGAQLAAGLLGAEPGMQVLDACAAPGGKTGHILERVDGRLKLIAADIDADRNQRVSENLRRLGYQAEVLTADLEFPDEAASALGVSAAFDRILVDAPCSGTGVIRRHPDIKFLRRAGDIPVFAERQGRILDTLWPYVKTGGRLLYVTCSVLRAENQDVVAAFLERHGQAIEIAPAADSVPDFAVRTDGPGMQLLPGNEETDGFYYALLERSDGSG